MIGQKLTDSSIDIMNKKLKRWHIQISKNMPFGFDIGLQKGVQQEFSIYDMNNKDEIDYARLEVSGQPLRMTIDLRAQLPHRVFILIGEMIKRFNHINQKIYDDYEETKHNQHLIYEQIQREKKFNKNHNRSNIYQHVMTSATDSSLASQDNVTVSKERAYRKRLRQECSKEADKIMNEMMTTYRNVEAQQAQERLSKLSQKLNHMF